MKQLMRWSVAALLLAAQAVFAQAYPAKPIRFVVGFAPGGSADVMARALVSQMQRQMGATVVVDNRPGAGGMIGYDLAAKADPDGYTLLCISSSFVTSIAVYPKLPFDYKKDYTPVSAFASGTANLLVVNAAYPATTVKELLVLAKNRDKPVTYGSPGIGSVQHFVAELFNMRSAAQLTHVPYKGQAPALTALLANEVNLTFLQPPGGFDLIKNGRLRAIAYAGAERWPAMPNLPTVLESGIDFHIKGPFEGLIAPRGLPRAIVDRLHAEVLRALEAPQLKEFLTASGWEADRRGPREFGEFIVSEVQRYTDIARAVGIKSE